MPLYGMPKILENSINNILDSANVSSWNIRGDDRDYLQVTIRFNMVDNNPTVGAIDQSNITYRRMTPSQVKRNKERAMMINLEKTEERENIVDNKSIPENQDYHNNNTTFQTKYPDQHEPTLVSNLSPLPAHQQVDGLVDTPYHSHIKVEASMTSGDIEVQSRSASSSHSDIADEVVPCTCDPVMISSDHITYSIKPECNACQLCLEPNDVIQCCFICETLYHRTCILLPYHNVHKSSLTKPMLFSDYIDTG